MAEDPALDVLLVEDNEHDLVAMRRAWRRAASGHRLHVVRDGVDCLDFLLSEGRFGAADEAPPPRPDLVLLDLNLPRLSGHEVLARIRSNPAIHLVPVLILSTSGMDRDRATSYQLGANAYVMKPPGFDALCDTVGRIVSFFEIIQPPGAQ